MAGKSVTISARIAPEDADFLAGLSVQGAYTPSDKLRHLLSEARRLHETPGDYKAALTQVQTLAAPAEQTWRAAENDTGRHSELVALTLTALPDIMAHLLASLNACQNTHQKAHQSGTQSAQKNGEEAMLNMLVSAEAGIADRLTGMVEAMLRLAVTAKSPCYDPDVLRSRLEPILELARLIDRPVG